MCVGIFPVGSNEDSEVNSQHYLLQIESSSPTQLLLLSAGWQSIWDSNATFTFTSLLPIYTDLFSKFSQITFNVVNFQQCSFGIYEDDQCIFSGKDQHNTTQLCIDSFQKRLQILYSLLKPSIYVTPKLVKVQLSRFSPQLEAKYHSCLIDTCHKGSLSSVLVLGWLTLKVRNHKQRLDVALTRQAVM